MHIKKIRIKNMMHFRDVEVALPEVGITLVTGDNGGGKSGLFVEAPATALWGKTFRNTPIWKDDIKGSIELVTDEVTVEKSKNPNSSPTIKWSVDNIKQAHPTVTKANAELKDIVGDWDTYRRTCILSTQEQEASYFTLATDSERKKLIEGLLDIDIFDPALKACRNDRNELQNKLSKLVTDCSVLKERVTNLSDNIEKAEDELGDPPAINTDDLKAKKETFKQEHKELQERSQKIIEKIRDNREEIITINKTLTETGAEVIAAEKEANRLNINLCPFCGEKISQQKKDSAQEDAKEKRRLATEAKKNTEAEISRINNEIAALEIKKEKVELRRSEISTNYQLINQEIKNLEQAMKDYEARRDSIDRTKKVFDSAVTEYKDKKKNKKNTKTELEEVLACETVLGLEGVRAQIIGKALGGIEAVANRWLAQIAGESLQLELRPYSETKTAGVKDKIALIIHGAGGGYGYKGASGGERRRIDVALLFALSEIAAAARGIQQGDIVVDEIADSLDMKGRLAVAEALKELSKERSVIAITHDTEFAKMLEPKQHVLITKKDGISTLKVN
jgi:DNA repair exonuclease SbcCD ATPase subunit